MGALVQHEYGLPATGREQLLAGAYLLREDQRENPLGAVLQREPGEGGRSTARANRRAERGR